MNTFANMLPLTILFCMVAAVVYVVRKARREPPVSSSQEVAPPPPGAAAPAVAVARSGGAGMVFERLCWLVTMLVAAGGAFRLFDLAMTNVASAPQYAAEAAGVCAWMIVPYVFSRAVGAFRRA